VVARVGIQKAQEFASGGEVHDLVDSGQKEKVFRACHVQACVVHTHPPFPTLFWCEHRVGNPIRVLNFLNEGSGQEPRELLTHGLALLLVEAP
jgi:hypothetical protein